MNISSRKGMTLLEISIASSILAILIVLAMSSFLDIMRMVDNQDNITRMDQRANRAFREIVPLVRPAIFPVPNRTGSTSSEVYEDIDDATYGFGGSNGTDWSTALQEGMDAIAFVVPVDAQHVGDYLDSSGHLQIGQQRSGYAYLAATAYGTPHTGTDFRVRGNTELVSALAAVPPDNLTSGAFSKIELPTTIGDWGSLYDSTVNVTAFMVVRFMPMLDDGGNPVEIHEAAAFATDAGDRDVDFDGDGLTTDIFHIGRLQLLYSGSSTVNYVESTPPYTLVTTSIDPLVLSLTSNVILRKVGDSTPIFRLVGFDNNFDSSTGNAGLVDESSKNGRMALRIRFLMVDHEGFDNQKKLLSKKLLTRLATRWYDTTVVLKNMER